MTTTACDDQFTVGTQTIEPVRQPYSTEAILHRNIADLEIALKRQTERAEAAEAELEAVRDDNHAMMLEIDGMRTERDRPAAELAKMREQEPVAYVKYKATGGNVGLSWVAIPTGAFYPREGEQLYAAPIPAVAVPAVPEEWREVLRECADDLAIELDQRYGDSRKYPSEQRKYEAEMQPVYRARALLQSADHSELAIEKVAPDCRACANRGRINGLSQESYCDSCIYQGRDWRKNHFVDASKTADAVKRRCDACAVLPCSCK